jgi:hypothetical protein
MQHRPQKMWLARFYWRAAKRWPVVHAMGCCWGLFVGFGALNLFWDPQPNKRQDVLLRPLGVFMLVGYGWFLGAFLLRLKRGTWSSHCDSQILFFSGIEPSTGKQVASARPAKSIDFTSNQILAASLVNLALATLLFVDVRLRWHDPFMPILVSIGLFSHPLLSYIAVRRMTETGFSWRWFFSAVLCLLGLFLWVLTVLTVYLRVSQSGQM